MIPKVIHLCWLSGDPFPEDIVKCLETWNEKLKGYTIWLWGKCPQDIDVLDKLNVEVYEFDLNSTIWTKQAFDAKKYAFAADYIRLYALYTYGGIYLDADVLVYKPFDDLLHLPYFVGCDQIRAFEAAVIGCEPGCNWIKEVFETYKNKQFINDDGSYDMLPLPCKFHHVLIDKGYTFVKLLEVNEFMNFSASDKILNVFAKDFFNSRNAIEVCPTRYSYCAHNYAGSWTIKSKTIKDEIKKILPKELVAMIYVVGQKTWSRKKFAWFQIPFEK